MLTEAIKTFEVPYITTTLPTPVVSTPFQEFEAAKEKAGQIYYFALGLLILSGIACARSFFIPDCHPNIRNASYVSFPLAVVFFIYAITQVQHYEFPKTVVHFPDVVPKNPTFG
jgi:hypothetical protein